MQEQFGWAMCLCLYFHLYPAFLPSPSSLKMQGMPAVISYVSWWDRFNCLLVFRVSLPWLNWLGHLFQFLLFIRMIVLACSPHSWSHAWLCLLLEGDSFQISNYLLIHPGGWNFRIFIWLQRLGKARQLYSGSQGKRLNSCFELMPFKSLSSVFVLHIWIWLQLVTV